jgi:hypothetical protein
MVRVASVGRHRHLEPPWEALATLVFVLLLLLVLFLLLLSLL